MNNTQDLTPRMNNSILKDRDPIRDKQLQLLQIARKRGTMTRRKTNNNNRINQTMTAGENFKSIITQGDGFDNKSVSIAEF